MLGPSGISVGQFISMHSMPAWITTAVEGLTLSHIIGLAAFLGAIVHTRTILGWIRELIIKLVNVVTNKRQKRSDEPVEDVLKRLVERIEEGGGHSNEQEEKLLKELVRSIKPEGETSKVGGAYSQIDAMEQLIKKQEKEDRTRSRLWKRWK